MNHTSCLLDRTGFGLASPTPSDPVKTIYMQAGIDTSDLRLARESVGRWVEGVLCIPGRYAVTTGMTSV